jgi:diaminopimelate decarboxylase/L-glutamyl-[BtrI acyl-carrier protein] decarboxylase
MKKQLLSNVDIFLSLKANPSIGLANLYNKIGACVEVASIGELKSAMVAGFSEDNIIFSGPGKRFDELNFAIDKGIYCIIIESFEEIMQIATIAETKNKIVDLGIRINPSLKNMNNSTIKMGGVSSQFGIEEEDIGKCIRYIKSNSYLRFKGIHVYTGTQILDYKKIIESVKYTLNLSIKIEKEYAINVEMIDFGGGFGVKYFEHEKYLDFQQFSKEFNELLISHRLKKPKTRYIIESGRYLLAESGYYLAKVNYIKESKGKTYIVVDGGLNHHQSSTFRGRLMRNNFPIKILNKTEKNTPSRKVSIVGPLCTPEDCLASDVLLPHIEVGDYICIENSGAYGLTYSPFLFLSHATPPEVLNIGTKDFVIRERINPEYFLENQSIIPSKEIENVLINQ